MSQPWSLYVRLSEKVMSTECIAKAPLGCSMNTLEETSQNQNFPTARVEAENSTNGINGVAPFGDGLLDNFKFNFDTVKPKSAPNRLLDEPSFSPCQNPRPIFIFKASTTSRFGDGPLDNFKINVDTIKPKSTPNTLLDEQSFSPCQNPRPILVFKASTPLKTGNVLRLPPSANRGQNHSGDLTSCDEYSTVWENIKADFSTRSQNSNRYLEAGDLEKMDLSGGNSEGKSTCSRECPEKSPIDSASASGPEVDDQDGSETMCRDNVVVNSAPELFQHEQAVQIHIDEDNASLSETPESTTKVDHSREEIVLEKFAHGPQREEYNTTPRYLPGLITPEAVSEPGPDLGGISVHTDNYSLSKRYSRSTNDGNSSETVFEESSLAIHPIEIAHEPATISKIERVDSFGHVLVGPTETCYAERFSERQNHRLFPIADTEFEPIDLSFERKYMPSSFDAGIDGSLSAPPEGQKPIPRQLPRKPVGSAPKRVARDAPEELEQMEWEIDQSSPTRRLRKLALRSSIRDAFKSVHHGLESMSEKLKPDSRSVSRTSV